MGDDSTPAETMPRSRAASDFAHAAEINKLDILARLHAVTLEQSDDGMLGGSALAHDADDFALQAGDVLDFGSAVERKTVGRHSHCDRHQIATGQDRIDDRTADAREIDIAGDHGLIHPGCAGNKNILHRHAIFLVELGVADQPERQHRAARLRVTDAHCRVSREQSRAGGVAEPNHRKHARERQPP